MSENQQRDQTKMINQPALRTSNGLIWMVMGGLFVAAVMIPFGLLAFSDGARSSRLALTCAIIVLALYAALLLSRFVVKRRVIRLRIMAACLLSMAAVSLIGIWVSALIENAPQ